MVFHLLLFRGENSLSNSKSELSMRRTRSTYLHQLSDLLPSEKVKKVHTSVALENFCHSSSSSCMVWQKFSNLEKKGDSRFFLQNSAKKTGGLFHVFL